MTGTARSNHPRRREPAVKVRQLQNRLWAAAKQSEGRRFHALYDRIHRSDVLWEAWERVRANRGAAGIDKVTVAMVEEHGVHLMLDELGRDLRAGTYRPSLVRRVEIPKPDGRMRPLGIPTVRDRVCQGVPAGMQDCSRTNIRGRLSCRCRSGSARNDRRLMRWRKSGWRSPRASSLSSRLTSRISSGRLTMTGSCRLLSGGCRIVGYSSCCVSGCRQACWTMVSLPSRSREPRRVDYVQLHIIHLGGYRPSLTHRIWTRRRMTTVEPGATERLLHRAWP